MTPGCVVRMRHVIVLVAVLAAAGATRRTRRQTTDPYTPCDNGLGSCVPYFQCYDGTIIDDGAGLLDLRYVGKT